MINLLASVVFVAIAVGIVLWCNRPDPQVVKLTKERRQMRLREECSARFEP